MSTYTPRAGHCLSDNAYLADLRQQMLKFAVLQLRDNAAAEDAVQDALIGAMKNADKFAGKAAFKSWVFAILKHKIIDGIRGKSRTVAICRPAGRPGRAGRHQFPVR